MEKTVILILPDGGLGNKVEAMSVYLALAKECGDASLYDQVPVHEDFFKGVTKQFNGAYESDPAVFNNYEKVYAMHNKYAKLSPRIKYTVRTSKQSEVADNERLLEYLKIKPVYDGIIWPAPKKTPKFDVVICNGSRNTLHWIRKRYLRWNEVVDSLKKKGYSVASVGHGNEYIAGTEDMTDIGLEKTVDVISQCKAFASNDTGLYHTACFINIPTAVVFTATSTQKNFNKDFHRMATVITPGLGCCPCQGSGKNLWLVTHNWNTCEDWKCTYFDPQIIIDSIQRRLK